MLRPAAEVDDQPMEEKFRRPRIDLQPAASPEDRLLRRIGRCGHMRAKAGKPGDLRRQVVREALAPQLPRGPKQLEAWARARGTGWRPRGV